MIQTSVAAPIQARPQPDSQENDLLDPLLRLAGDIYDARALVIAEHGLNLMCGLIQCGCLAATVLRASGKPDADDYDVVFVPRAESFPSSEGVIRLARRSLAPNGQLIVGVQDGRAAAALARRLRLNGFSTPRLMHLPGRTLLRADLRRLA